MKKWILLILTPLLFIFTLSTYAIDLPNRPDNGIYDPSHYLNETVVQNLANTNKNNDTQIGVYIVDNIDSSIEDTSREVARHWKIGDSKNNRGILIAIAVKDKKLRIETSNEVSGDLTDIEAKQIITNVKPELRSQDYSMAVNKMIEQIKEKTANQTENNNYEVPGIIPMIGVVLLLLAGIISALDINNSGGSGGSGGGSKDSDFTTGILLGGLLGSSSSSSSGWSSGGSDWSSSDWSGGGFDGGGASGDW